MNTLKSFFIGTFFILITQFSFGQNNINMDENNLAVKGYDVVNYFTQHEAVRGNSEHSATVDGATYYFTSAEHLKAFNEAPGNYLPQFGGYCAFGMAQGANAPADPQTFKIRDGQLFLFYNDFYEGNPFNTIVPWNASEAEMLSKANANWSKK